MTVVAITADGRKIVVGTIIGPTTSVSVPAGGATNIDISIGLFELSRKDEALSVRSITGLPDGIVLVGFSFTNLDTLRIRVFNPTTSAITITANSITATVTLLGT